MTVPSDPVTNLNLEQQRKRAKDLRRVHRDGGVEAAVRIARHLPRARNQSPEQVLASGFTLSEAQFVIAREAGFSSWPRMKSHIEQAVRAADASESIIEAALAGNDDAVRAVLTHHPNAARSSIHVAAVLADADALIDADASIVERTGGKRQWTPLLYLCASRYRRTDSSAAEARIRIARRLLDLGADVNAKGEELGFVSWNVTLFEQEEWRPIDAAAVHAASAELVALLLKTGADLEKTGAAVSQAVRGGNTEVLKVVLAALPESLLWQVGWAAKAAVLLNRPDMARMLAAQNAPQLLEHALLDAIRLERGADMVEALIGIDAGDPSTPVLQNAYRAARRYAHREAVEILRRRGLDDAVLTDVDRVIAAGIENDAGAVRHVVAQLQDLKAAFREDDHRMLAWAARTGRYPTIPLLLEAGLNPDIPDRDGETPLHLAVRAKSPETVDLLVRVGARVDALDFDAQRPLDLALTIQDDHIRDQITRRLLEGGAHPAPESPQLEREEMNVLFEDAADAVVFGDIDKLRALLDEEPFLVHARSPRPHRATLLNYCGSNGVEAPRQRLPENAPEILQLLLDRGADVNATCNLYGGGATTLGLHLTSIHPFRTSLRTVLMEIFLNAGAILDGARGAEGIVGAAALGRLDRVKALSTSATASQIQDAFMWACEYGRGDVVEFLLEKGVDVHAQNGNGMTGLHLAAVGGHLEIVKLLVERGSPLEERNIWGGTVLGNTLWGAVNGDPRVDYTPVVEFLIQAGAKVASGYLPWWAEQNLSLPSMKERIEKLLREGLNA
jgi:ankyrin repeat protein